MWLSRPTFRQLTQRAARESVEAPSLIRPAAAQSRPQDGPSDTAVRYRPCADCQKLMQRRQYAPGSGVIIDICRDHGVWLDSDELPRILEWLRAGGSLAATPDEKHIAAQPPSARQRRVIIMERNARFPRDDVLDEMAEAAFQLLRRVFR